MGRLYHFRLLALSGMQFALACPPTNAQAKAAEASFAKDIAPILYQHCSNCHRPNGVGPFSLLTYEEARKRARQISEVVSTRYMPPWKPNPGHGPELIGSQRLTEAEIGLIQRWHLAGAPSGNLDQAPKIPSFPEEWELGEPDIVLELPEPYLLPAEGQDIYRNFVIPLPIQERRFIQSVEFHPKSRLALHHALLLEDKTANSLQRDALEPGPGFDGMGIGSASYISNQLIGWTPGQVPFQAPSGTALTLDPGTSLVLQGHFLPTGKPEAIRPRIGLRYAKSPPTKQAAILQLRALHLDIPPNEANYTVEESLTIPVDVSINGLYPHAHYLGKDLKIFAALPDGSKRWLLRISDWDFNWQRDYRFAEPLRLPADSRIVMSYSFDNSADNPRNPSNPPRRVYGGWKSTDEMAEVAIQLTASSAEDLSALQQAQLDYDIDAAGGLSRYSYNLGSQFEQQGLYDRAARAYQNSIKEDPAFASAHFKLGSLAERAGEIEAAETHYREAIRLQPELIPPQVGLAKILYIKGKPQETYALLKKALEISPSQKDARLYLARALANEDRPSEAIQLLQAGLSHHAQDPDFRLELGKQLSLHGDPYEAIKHLEFAATRSPSSFNPESQFENAAIQSEAYFSMGELYASLSDYLSAEKNYDKAIGIMPAHGSALLASAAIALISYNEALAYRRFLDLAKIPSPQQPPLSEILPRLPFPQGPLILSKALEESGQREKAVQTIELASQAAAERSDWLKAFQSRKLELKPEH